MRKVLLCILTFILVVSVAAQERPNKNRPKVGLVLSGGGAKGFAHIGALKIIDSLDIKIDYVAGTSMGAIVGSLYASGYSGKQLDSLFKLVDIDNLVNDNIPRSNKNFYERDNSERYAVTLPFNKFELKLPSALSRGQNVYSFLTQMTLHVNELESFEELPIPFFCMATNVENGEAVLLDSGNLALAVRASGSLPTLFQPVKIGDTYLIDGGVTNNYPIDELKAKGMDVIIGVDVQDGLATIEEMGSAPEILVQVNNFRTIKDMVQKRQKTDIYIKPDITDFSVISFSEGKKIVESGSAAARKKIEEMKGLPRYEPPFSRKLVKMAQNDSIRFNSVEIKGNERYNRAYILGKMKLKTGEQIPYSDFVTGLNNLLATNNFVNLQYDINDTERVGIYDLEMTVQESQVTTLLKAGLHYDDLYKSAALVNLTKKRLLFNNDILSLDLIVGDNVRYDFNYYIDKGFYWSVGLKSRFNQFTKSVNPAIVPDAENIIPEDVNRLEVNLQDQTNQFYLQTLFRKDFALSVGAEHKRLRIQSETISLGEDDSEITFENTDYFSTFGTLKLDTYNSKYFPKRGVYFSGDFHLYLLASDFNSDFSQFSIAKADIGYAVSFTDKFSLNVASQGGFKVGDDATPSLNFALGGYGNNFINNLIPFYGREHISLTGNSFVKATFTFDYELFYKHHIVLAANYANVEDDIFETGEWLTVPDYSGYALGYGIETFLGPMDIKYTYSPDTNDSIWLFTLGFWF